jgi:hypothetical protein
MNPNAGEGGGGVAGPQYGTAAVHRSPINFGDLTPYLNYVISSKTNNNVL